MPFKKINRMYPDPTARLFLVIIHIIGTGNPLAILDKEGRKRVWIAPRLRVQRN